MKKLLFLGVITLLQIILCEKDLYKVLEVKRSASQSEIKKKYREMTRKHHPDRNQDNKEKAKEKFAEIAEAYEILFDAKKRRLYDRGGMEAVKEDSKMQEQGGFDPFDMFGGGFGGQQQHQQRRDKDLKIRIRCTLKDLYLGKEFDVIFI